MDFVKVKADTTNYLSFIAKSHFFWICEILITVSIVILGSFEIETTISIILVSLFFSLLFSFPVFIATNHEKTQKKSIEINEKMPVCQSIIDSLSNIYIKTNLSIEQTKEYAITPTIIENARKEINNSYSNFSERLKKQYPPLSDSDISCCCLLLLPLNKQQIAAAFNTSYRTEIRRMHKLSEMFGVSEKEIHNYLTKFAYNR